MVVLKRIPKFGHSGCGWIIFVSKEQSMGESVEPLSLPDVPLSGWERVDEGNYTVMAKKIPCVTPGVLSF